MCRIFAALAIILSTGVAGASDVPVEAPSGAWLEQYGNEGEQVMLRFSPVPGATGYRIWREILVSSGLDASGRVIQLDPPQVRWVPWGKVDEVDQVCDCGEVRVVVSTLDNVATRWGVSTLVLRDGVEYSSPIQPVEEPVTLVRAATWGRVKSSAGLLKRAGDP